MSYDLEVLAAMELNAAEGLPGSGWIQSGDAWVVRGKAWQIVVGAPQRLEPEDIPEEAGRIVAGLAWRVEINVEPVSAMPRPGIPRPRTAPLRR